ncbi:TPA: EpsG family protein [Morganella morganii]|uniref:EpsG family protein n=2 Tax=Morganella morganii TaxID=582 RepID=UPI0009007241|nr:EpsG family protein [Morganella morganii]EJF7775830.1 EpsG family protein [Salmonella enterica subsp. enterica]MBT0314691.1 EpsG family protein [Morganella morganii subsp. morganii]SGD50085.1 Uncharacterised protein [Mycobacterium tuberculosis]EKU4289536.1 EpsG family protein [Morganella morganii]
MISEYSPLFIIIISLLFLAISIVFEINKNKQLSSLIALIIILSYSIIFGLRDYSIGSDTSSYVDNFLYSNWNFEYLFSLITTIIQTLTNEPQIYLVIMTVIYGITIYLYTAIYGKKINTSIVIFTWCIIFSPSVLLGTINYLRQPLAFTLFFIGFSLYTTTRKITIAPFLIMFLSIFVHSSTSILVLFSLLVKHIKIKYMVILLILSIFIFLSGLMNTIIDSHGDNYIIQRTIARHIYFNPRRSITTIYLNIILYLFHYVILLFLFYSDRDNHEAGITLKLYSFILSLSIFLSFNRELSLRYYYLLQFIIPISYMCFTQTSKYRKLIKPFLILYCLSYLCYLLTRPWFIDQLSGNITP